LLDCHAGFEMSDDPQKTRAAHDSLIRQPGDLKGLRGPHFRRWSDPRERHVRQYADDRVPHATQRDAAPNDIRLSAHPLAPEGFGHDRDVSGFFFVRQKVAPANWSHAEHIEIVRRHLTAQDLHRIADPGESKRGLILSGEAIEDRLTLAKMLKAR